MSLASSSPLPDPVLETLLQWFADNNIWIDPRIRIASDRARPEAGYGVYALADIPYGVPVSKTPKTAVLSIRSCTLSDQLYPLIKDIDQNIALAVALLSEQLLGRESRFWGYLQSFPQGGADIGMFWRWKAEDGMEAMRWLRGTEAEALMRGSLLGDLERVYAQIVRPALEEWQPTMEQFRQAYSLVSSRAFQVDFWHGVGLVPVADAFNHAEENNVFMETDFAVCPMCGSLGPCAHPSHQPRHSSPWDEPMTCDMVTYSPITSGQEVFNSYDEKGFSNAQLLVHYGFLLEGNGEDWIKWDGAEVEEVLGDTDATWDEERWERVRDAAKDVEEEMEDLEALVTPAESEEIEDEDDDDDTCWIDAEGRMSQSLFLHLFARNASDSPDVTLLLHLVLSVMRLIGTVQLGEKGVLAGIPLDVLRTLKSIARDVKRLSETRVAGMYKPQLETSDLAALLDTSLGPRTKLALSYALTERLMLETCSIWWEDLASFIDSDT
ncbi:SET domain-containing protein [Calocera viscosa TUFC12733]|uniref:SET domain-containing protein n=1 Tax=Calocera viscosa (strain TUFC12733) TaxID=1330018 RepID=A0A167ISA6_CALVF|nr:SET domain-containing protein [Calocera viscosa TUFC12733]